MQVTARNDGEGDIVPMSSLLSTCSRSSVCSLPLISSTKQHTSWSHLRASKETPRLRSKHRPLAKSQVGPRKRTSRSTRVLHLLPPLFEQIARSAALPHTLSPFPARLSHRLDPTRFWSP